MGVLTGYGRLSVPCVGSIFIKHVLWFGLLGHSSKLMRASASACDARDCSVCCVWYEASLEQLVTLEEQNFRIANLHVKCRAFTTAVAGAIDVCDKPRSYTHRYKGYIQSIKPSTREAEWSRALQIDLTSRNSKHTRRAQKTHLTVLHKEHQRLNWQVYTNGSTDWPGTFISRAPKTHLIGRDSSRI